MINESYSFITSNGINGGLLLFFLLFFLPRETTLHSTSEMATCMLFSKLCQFQAVKVSSIFCCSQIHSQSMPLWFHTAQKLWAEPMKKKKRVDPSILAARSAKKIKRIEKEIKRLAKIGRILKPIDELEIDNKKLKLASERKREPTIESPEATEMKALLTKEWGRYRSRQWRYEYKIYQQLVHAQQEALVELRAEAEELYKAALQVISSTTLLIDYALIPVDFQGPKLTPAIQDYSVPDGEYVDTTRKY
ncbi:unnamed protein product [Lymnaea stagnalis]|uniref:Large ribosomal subunit protein mL40 n=1 Tax=Lymnaea stagnalis TaxID=6523 RepID=A0AAV2ID55_LYMST